MVFPVQPSDSKGFIDSSQTPQERQKLFEIQFETSVLSAYVNITGQNHSLENKISQLKTLLGSGGSPDMLVAGVNGVIKQINNQNPSDKVGFPTLMFTNEGNQDQAANDFALTLKKFINVAAEKGVIREKDAETLVNDLDLMNSSEQVTKEQAFNQLNKVIDTANQFLPVSYQLPPIHWR